MASVANIQAISCLAELLNHIAQVNSPRDRNEMLDTDLNITETISGLSTVFSGIEHGHCDRAKSEQVPMPHRIYLLVYNSYRSRFLSKRCMY